MMRARTIFTVLVLAATVCQAGAKSLLQKASFDETYERYPSPYAIIEQFKRIVPVRAYESDECLQMGEKGGPVGGVIDPLQNGALEQEPGPLFFEHYQTCVRSLVSSAMYSKTDENLDIILGADLKTKVQKHMSDLCLGAPDPKPEVCYYPSDSLNNHLWTQIPWKMFPEADRREIIRAMISFLVGPEIVLRANGLVGKDSTFGRPMNSVEDLVTLLYDFTNQDMADGSVFYFSNVYAEIAIVLRLGPALKS